MRPSQLGWESMPNRNIVRPLYVLQSVLGPSWSAKMKSTVSNGSKASARATALTAEQEAQLTGVKRVLGALTTPALIYEAARIRLADPSNRSRQDAVPQSLASYAVAAVKVMAYVPHDARDANKERVRIGRAIDKMDQKSRQLALIDPMGAIAPSVDSADRWRGCKSWMLQKLRNRREPHPHFAAPCAQGCGIQSEHRQTETRLKTFEELRHFYEHIENRSPRQTRDPGPSVDRGRRRTRTGGSFSSCRSTALAKSHSTARRSSSIHTVRPEFKCSWSAPGGRMAPSIMAETEKYLRKHP